MCLPLALQLLPHALPYDNTKDAINASIKDLKALLAGKTKDSSPAGAQGKGGGKGKGKVKAAEPLSDADTMAIQTALHMLQFEKVCMYCCNIALFSPFVALCTPQQARKELQAATVVGTTCAASTFPILDKWYRIHILPQHVPL